MRTAGELTGEVRNRKMEGRERGKGEGRGGGRRVRGDKGRYGR